MSFSSEPTIRSARGNIAEPENQQYLANVYWHVIVLGVLVLTLLSMAYGAYEFFTPLEEGAASVPGRAQALDTDELRAVVEKLEKRSAAFEQLLE